MLWRMLKLAKNVDRVGYIHKLANMLTSLKDTLSEKLTKCTYKNRNVLIT